MLQASVPCLSIMNMPPLAYLRRIEALADANLSGCYADPSVWSAFEPGLISLCSPDPQAFPATGRTGQFSCMWACQQISRPAQFESEEHNQMLRTLEQDIAAVRLDGKDVPVKLRGI